MGNVQVQYKQRRGANEAGADITDPKEYLTELLMADFATTKGIYDALDDDQKAQFRAFFGEDEDPLESDCAAEMWMTANEEDPEAI